MSWLQETDPIKQGHWGEVTSTLLWCERKYVWTKWIAEPVNTLTNLLFIFVALYGAFRVVQQGFPLRLACASLGLGIVGMGSFLFHMTLKHEAQLLDELPMIWASSFASWCLLDVTMSTRRRLNPYVLPAVIGATVVFVSATYVWNKNPVFHQVAYALIFAYSSINAIIAMTHPDSPFALTPAARVARAHARRLQLVGTGVFLLGFFVWNIDNIYCGWLRGMRDAVGYPWAVLLEGHGWWHILTCTGAYLILLACEVIVISYKEHPENISVQYGLLPYVKRVKPDDPRRRLLVEYAQRKAE
ncbi:hypothetical protein MSPP1_003695 [Malassezia sp. CBS 17886]|nr:hypothetical protein MSPP1_003695 [Malassezia sp. CBS 17886]